MIEESIYSEVVSGEVTDCLASVCLSIVEQSMLGLEDRTGQTGCLSHYYKNKLKDSPNPFK